MKNWNDCEKLLRQNKAPNQLIKHLYLVSSVAKEISDFLINIKVHHNQELVICGSGLHDFGKIVFTNELSSPGSNHEDKGKELLLSLGISSEIAQCCVSHAKWSETDKIEELIVALADKLWKGQRNSELELKLIDLIAKIKNQDRWDLFSDIDLFFESIADNGTQRLEESKKY